MSSVSPEALVRFLGTPAETYCERVEVSPARARSKSLAARSRAAGGSSDGDLGGSDVEGVGAAAAAAAALVVVGVAPLACSADIVVVGSFVSSWYPTDESFLLERIGMMRNGSACATATWRRFYMVWRSRCGMLSKRQVKGPGR